LIKDFFKKIGLIFEDIKLPHSLFALPFALLAAFLAKNGAPSVREFFWIILAMVGARSGAMSFNRLADVKIDSVNPRTAKRVLPSGAVRKAEMAVFIVISYAVFVFAAWNLNRLCFYLSPIAIAWVSFYSLTKRFTLLSHFVLGMSLGIAPMGAWIAIKGRFDLAPFFISAAVLLWVAGFDILYSIQDIEADKQQGLHSIPRFFSIGKSLWIARSLHAVSVLLLLGPYFLLKLGPIYLAGIAIISALFIWEHRLIRPDDLSKLNIAFFNMNGWISVTFFIFGALDILVRR
jgi:4-hydroxybenzoate polyprenyltransferase